MRAVKLRLSQSLANLRQRLNQAIDRSTTEHFLTMRMRGGRPVPRHLRAAEVRSGSDLDGVSRPT
jgi:hypothetical protein